MVTNHPLIIGYGGTLDFYHPKKRSSSKAYISNLINYFFNYNHNLVDKSTRSGYYLFKGIKFLLENNPDYSNSIKVFLWGNIHPINNQQVIDFKINQIVTIDGFYSKQDTQEKLAQCDLLFLPLERGVKGSETLFIPGKLFEYLKFKKPILALTENSDCKRIIENSGLGLFATPDNPVDIARALKFCIQNKNQLNKVFTPNHQQINQYSFQYITKQLSECFDILTKRD